MKSTEVIPATITTSDQVAVTKNHPGIYVPPPMIYAAFFVFSLLLNKIWTLQASLLDTRIAQAIGWIFIALYLLLAFISIRQFVLSKNTIVTIKPAKSLQTTGIYAITRNPMYLSLVFFYCGLAVFFGNWWTFAMIPLLILVIQVYVIGKEEQYLEREFGGQYDAYRQKVRRWI